MRVNIAHALRLGLVVAALCGSAFGQAPASDQPSGAVPAASAGAAPVGAAQAAALPTSAAAPNPAKIAEANAGKAHDDHFIIGNDDMLAINVWKEQEVSRVLPVRSDGRISLPLVGELQAAGRTPLQLEKEIAERLKEFITDPEVTVMVQQINSQKYNILGQVNRPGSFPLTLTTSVLDAIAAAGGFRDFAKQKGIYVLRQNPNGAESRIPFNYKEVIKGKNAAQNVKLEPNDTVVVP
jgi:polysaccharide export outer membrane protein